MMTYGGILLSLILLSFGQAYGQEATRNQTVIQSAADKVENGIFNDGSCSQRLSDRCCYQGLRYNCQFLLEMFRSGYCRPNAKDRSRRSWRRCPNMEKIVKGAQAQTPPARKEESASPRSLPYADTFTSCAAEGRQAALRYARQMGRRSGAGYCAVAVRHAMMCKERKEGRRPLRTIHCGPSAFSYYGNNCMERYGYKKDMSQCNTPGVVRVYYGHRHRDRRARGGDRHGHIEFLGTDGRWHAGVSNPQPINHPSQAGPNRRKLKACYVRK